MKIGDMFRRDISRTIEEVVKVDLGDDAIVADEIREYVVTDHILANLEEIVDAYQETINNPSQKTTVWVSGFFGSGKSSFAKMLGYLIANPAVAGSPAADLILGRVASKRLEALANTVHAQAPTLGVFLDLSTGRDVLAAGESLILPMYRALLTRLDYSRNELLAELEFSLEGDGRLAEFEVAFADATGGKDWRARRHNILAKNEASHALHLIRPDTFPAADSWAKTTHAPEINHNWFADRALELLARRGGGAKRLMFVVDEVGQYVARSIDRMLDLQGVAEAFQKKVGPLWLVVTSQEKLEDVVDSLESNRIELARAKDRFSLEVDLLPSDIYEVASRRVLDKTDAGSSAVRDLFAANRQKLAANVRLESSGRETDLAEAEFVRLYPLVPYQIDLLIDAVSARRAQGVGSPTLGGSNRTIIKLIQQLVVNRQSGLGRSDVGALATTDRAATLLEGVLPTAWRGEIDQIAERHGSDSPHAQVMRTVALTSDVKALPLTEVNLAAMLHPAIDAESCRPAIQTALADLVAEDRLRPGDDGYHIQSPEQKGWEKIRRGKAPTPADAIRIRKSILRDALAALSVNVGRVFHVELWVEGEKLTDGQIALHIEEADPARRGDLRDLSREQAAQNRIHWAYVLGDDTYDAVVELFRSEEMIRLKDNPSKTQADLELIGEERKRRSAHERKVLERLMRDLLDGQTVFRGKIEDAPASATLAAVAKRIVEDRIEVVYTQLDRFAVAVDRGLPLTMLRADDLNGLPPTLGDDGIGLLTLTAEGTEIRTAEGPLAELLDEIDNHAHYGQIVTGKVLEQTFAAPPRGAPLEVVQLLAAAGVRAGKLEVTHQGGRIVSASDARLDKVFGTVPAFRQASFAPAKDDDDVPIEVRTGLAVKYQKLTGDRPKHHDVGGLAKALRDHFGPYGQRCIAITSGLRGAGIPVPDAVSNTQNVVVSLPDLADADVIRQVGGVWTDLVGGCDVVDRLHETIDEDLDLYRRARQEVTAGPTGLPETAAKALSDLDDLLAAGDIVTHRADIVSLTQTVSDARREAQTAAAAELAERIAEARRKIETAYPALDEAAVSEALRPVGELAPPDDPTSVALDVLAARAVTVATRAAEAERRLDEIVAEGRLAWVDIASIVPHPIETEEHLGAALDAIRDAAEKHLADDKQVRLR